jgi:hypothetical protein
MLRGHELSDLAQGDSIYFFPWLLPIFFIFCFSDTLGATWTQNTFADFSKGHFEDGGANIYVSAAGRIQLVNRLDLNNDGYIDLFIGNGHGHTESEDVFVYLNNGTEIDPLRRLAIPANGAVQGLVADFDKDGRNDLVVVNAGWRSETFIYYGGQEGFTPQKRVKLPAWSGMAAAAADWNGDGWTDLAIACANPDPPAQGAFSSIIYWNSRRGFDPKHSTRLPGSGRFVLASDLNGDGLTDLAIAQPDETRVYWATKQSLAISSPSILKVPAFHLSAGDIDRDGYKELLLLNEEGVKILKGGSAGPTLPFAAELEMSDSGEAVLVDLDHDDYLDLAVTRRYLKGNEYTDSAIFWNKAGSFSLDRLTLLPTVYGSGISTGDLNGDGWPDLVISNRQSINNLNIQSFIYWNSRGAFHFARKTMLDTRRAQGNCVGDLNNDGFLDVVFFNYEGGVRSGYNPNFIYWGDGTRDYSPKRRSCLWSGYSVGTIQADFDDDSWVDLVSVEARYALNRPATLHGVYLWYGSPEGYSEDNRVVLSVQDPETGAHAADVNRDGYLDIIVGAAEEHPGDKVGYVILYGGPHGFSPNRREVIPLDVLGRRPSLDKKSLGVYREFKTPRDVGRPPLVADFDKDGYLDLAGGSLGPGLYFVHGSANGFQTDRIKVMLRGRLVAQVEAADFNSDGWLDLVVPDAKPDDRESDLLVLYGSEEGFSEDRAISLPNMTGKDPSVADYNRDGYLDLFFSNYASNDRRSLPCYFYWGGPRGFQRENRSEIPGDGATASLPADFDGDGWIDLFLANHRRDGDLDRPGEPARHTTPSFIYWNSSEGFDVQHRTEIPTVGPHAQITRDPGNIYTRELAEAYVSPPYCPKPVNLSPWRIDWEAETPLGTSVTFQVRSSPTEKGLESAEWKGPSGTGSYFKEPAAIPSSIVTGPWVQYRARLVTPNAGPSPILTSVTIQFQ